MEQGLKQASLSLDCSSEKDKYDDDLQEANNQVKG